MSAGTGSRPRVLLLVPDGVGYRNFVLGALPELLGSDAELLLLHGLPPALLAEAGAGPARFAQVRAMPDLGETIGARLYREAKSLAQIYWRSRQDAGSVQLRQRRTRGSVRARLFGLLVRTVARLHARPSALERLHRRHEAAARRSAAGRSCERELERLAPDIVFCTHQRASRAVPWMAAARRLGVPAATFIFSWDNLPKGRMAVPADSFFVWGEQMRRELLTYHPGLAAERVAVTGTPQFEPYFHREPTLDREAFLERCGLDPGRATICFSGDDLSSSPRDPDYLADLAAGLRRLPAAERPQILFRRCPVDLSGRHDGVLRAYPEIADVPPAWRGAEPGDWQRVLPTAEDVALLHNVVAHCDLVANIGSTMALDFALLGKPALYFGYEPSGAAPSHPSDALAASYARRWSAADIYRLPHFRTVHELGPVHWARTREQVVEIAQAALRRPAALERERQRWIARLLERPLDRASERCAEEILRRAGSRPREERYGAGAQMASDAESPAKEPSAAPVAPSSSMRSPVSSTSTSRRSNSQRPPRFVASR